MHARVGVCTGSSVFMSTCLYVWEVESTLGVAFHHHFFALNFFIICLFICWLISLYLKIHIFPNLFFFINLLFEHFIHTYNVFWSNPLPLHPLQLLTSLPPIHTTTPGFTYSLYNPLSPLEHGHAIWDCIPEGNWLSFHQKLSIANSSSAGFH